MISIMEVIDLHQSYAQVNLYTCISYLPETMGVIISGVLSLIMLIRR